MHAGCEGGKEERRELTKKGSEGQRQKGMDKKKTD